MDETLFEEKLYRRYSHITEFGTYLVVLVSLLLVHIPIGIHYNFSLLYILAGITVAFAFIWHRFGVRIIPASFINLIESTFDMLLIILLIYFTGGAASIFLILLIFPVINSINSSRIAGNLILCILAQFFLLMLLVSQFSEFDLIRTALVMMVLVIVNLHLVSTKNTIKKIGGIYSKHQALIQELKEINKYKDEFVYVTTHELRSPISVIRGYLDLLEHDKESIFSEKSKDMLKRLDIYTNSLSNLVGQLLNVSRIETGKLNVEYKEFGLQEFLMAILEDMQLAARGKRVRLEFESHVSETFTIVSDKEHLKEIIVNLLDNAIKYSKKDGLVVLGLDATPERIEISVKDNGIGIPQEDQKRIFQKFFRAKNVYKLASQGTGLGLYIVYKLVDILKGYVQFSSKENEGTTFRVQLPLQHTI